MSSQEPTGTQQRHSSFGDKLKGAAHVVHGMGDNIRGSMLSPFESSSGAEEAKSKDEDLVVKGKAEIQRGIAQMKGVPPPTGADDSEPRKEVKTAEQPQPLSTEEETLGPTPAPPPSPVQTRQAAEQETSRKEPEKETVTQPVSQESQAGTTTSPQTGDKSGEAPAMPQWQGKSA